MTKPVTRPPSAARIITAACIGNALEWYDIAVYSYFAAYLSQAFFKTDSAALSMFLTLGTFAVSFLIRPIGAIVLGGYADRAGRKPALTLSIMMMAVGTLLICVMPTADAIGPLAAIGVLIARLIQGFAAGGEFGSATALMVEHLPHRRGFAASWQFTSQAISSLIAALLGTGLITLLTKAEVQSWGFRIPFIVGLLVAPVGLYIRNVVPEPEESRRVLDAKPAESAPMSLLRRGKAMVVLTMGVLAASTCVNYLLSYIPTYSIKTLHLADWLGFAASIASAIVLMCLTPFAGAFSDRFGQVRMMIPAGVGILVACYPLFLLLTAVPQIGTLVVVVVVLSALKSMYYGPLGALMSSLFPPETRATGLAVGYNVGVAIFGGFTPLVVDWLINLTGHAVAPAYWVMFAAVVSLVSLLILRTRYGKR